MKTTKEMIEVMQASLEGKPIQYRVQSGGWIDTDKPKWDWNLFEYRVKPEPKYRPFNSAEEVLEAIEEHGDWLKFTNSFGNVIHTRILSINEHIDRDKNRLYIQLYGDKYSVDMCLREYTFVDGTPFGKLEE